MVDKDQEIKKPNNHTFNSITKSVRWILYTLLFAIFMTPTSFLTYIYVYSESKVTEISILKSFVEESLAMCTSLAPVLGYDVAASIAKKAFAQNKTVKQVVIEEKILDKKEAAKVLDPKTMIKPSL